MVEAAAVEIRKVDKFYGPFQALKDVSLSILPGKVTCLIGPSGSGKSTLLRCINFLEEYDSGEITIDGQLIGYATPGGRRMPGRRLREMRRSIGMVFQQFNLWPHMTALQNVAEGLVRVRGLPKAEAGSRAAEALRKVGLADKMANHPSRLSGGQQQRVAIARAIVTRPTLLVADEPTGNLDTARSHEIMELLTRLNGELGLTVAMVPHEPDIAAYAQRTIRFLAGHVASDSMNAEAAA